MFENGDGQARPCVPTSALLTCAPPRPRDCVNSRASDPQCPVPLLSASGQALACFSGQTLGSLLPACTAVLHSGENNLAAPGFPSARACFRRTGHGCSAFALCAKGKWLLLSSLLALSIFAMSKSAPYSSAAREEGPRKPVLSALHLWRVTPSTESLRKIILPSTGQAPIIINAARLSGRKVSC